MHEAWGYITSTVRSPRPPESLQNIPSRRRIGPPIDADTQPVSRRPNQRGPPPRSHCYTLPGFQVGFRQRCSRSANQTSKIPGYRLARYQEVGTVASPSQTIALIDASRISLGVTLHGQLPQIFALNPSALSFKKSTPILIALLIKRQKAKPGYRERSS